MTVGARLRLICGKPAVVEKPPSKRELRGRLNVVRLGQRQREAARQIPIEARIIERARAAARRGNDERCRGDQEAPFHHERNVEACAVSGAVWPWMISRWSTHFANASS